MIEQQIAEIISEANLAGQHYTIGMDDRDPDQVVTEATLEVLELIQRSRSDE